VFFKKNLKDSFQLEDIVRNDIKLNFENYYFVDSDWKAEGVTDQFLNNAYTYNNIYFNRLDFDYLVSRSLNCAKIGLENKLLILDIGSGGGPSVFSASKLMPNSKIIASDISPQLLNILGNIAIRENLLGSRVNALCFDLHKDFFKKNIFDLIMGFAILHHLVDPYMALKNLAKSLKKGGKIILIEPMESGHLLLLTIFDEIMKFLNSNKMQNSPLFKLAYAQRIDIQARLGCPIIKKDFTEFLDDKWVFSEYYLTELCKQLNLSSVNVFSSVEVLDNLYKDTFISLVNDSGNSHVVIPEGILDILEKYDHSISNNLKSKLLTTGIIVFEK
jgi:SAM-dependent methyltransferase